MCHNNVIQIDTCFWWNICCCCIVIREWLLLEFYGGCMLLIISYSVREHTDKFCCAGILSIGDQLIARSLWLYWVYFPFIKVWLLYLMCQFLVEFYVIAVTTLLSNWLLWFSFKLFKFWSLIILGNV